MIRVFLTWSLLSFYSFSFLWLPSSNARVLQEYSKCARVWGNRENRERAPKVVSQKLWTDPQKHFLLMKPLFSSIFIIFLQFPPHMQHVTFHVLFIPFSIIFINKIPITSLTFPKLFILPFPISLNHNKPNEHPLGFFPNIQLGICVPWPWYYLSLLNLELRPFEYIMSKTPRPRNSKENPTRNVLHRLDAHYMIGLIGHATCRW